MAENYNPYEETDEAHPETSAIAEDSAAESKGADDETTGDRVASELVDRAQKLAPKQVAEGLKQLKPYLLAAGKFARKCYPYVVRGYGLCNQGWHAMQPYHPEEFLPALGGLVLVFFGGQYFTTIAAFEAFKLCGWTQVSRSASILYSNYKLAKAASDKDDLVDDDNDGIADVKQITSKQLVERKVRLVLKTVDPNLVSEALTGTYVGVVGVIAALKIQFAGVVTLGASIADVFKHASDKILRPVLEEALPGEFHKWIPFMISYGTKGVAVSLAWFMQRFISAFHSAVRGAQLFLRGSTKYLVRHKHIKPDQVKMLEEGSRMFDLLVAVIAGMGFLWQVRSGFSLPFPLNLLLLPFTICEWLLMWLLQ